MIKGKNRDQQAQVRLKAAQGFAINNRTRVESNQNEPDLETRGLVLCVGLTSSAAAAAWRLPQTAPRLTPLPRAAAPATLAPYQQTARALISASPTSPPTATPFPAAGKYKAKPEVYLGCSIRLLGMEASGPNPANACRCWSTGKLFKLAASWWE